MVRRMFGYIFAAVLASVAGASVPDSAWAQDAAAAQTAIQLAEPARQTIGWGRIFNNDYMGDSKDR